MQLDVARSAKASDARVDVTFMQWSSLKKIGSLASADVPQCCRFSLFSASTEPSMVARGVARLAFQYLKDAGYKGSCVENGVELAARHVGQCLAS
jgi:hypothetical protein